MILLSLAGCGGAGGATIDAAADSTSSAADATDAACDTGKLWNALADAALGVARLGSCAPATIGTSAEGEIVLDSEGRVIDNTGQRYRATSSKQAWLDSLANDRWPCLAGQTIPYQCIVD